jgi:hypothetical protein
MKRTKWPKTVTVFGRKIRSAIDCESLWIDDDGVLCEAVRLDGDVGAYVEAGELFALGTGTTLPAAIADAEAKLEAEWTRIGELLGYEVTR